jgi:hypothetical protein
VFADRTGCLERISGRRPVAANMSPRVMPQYSANSGRRNRQTRRSACLKERGRVNESAQFVCWLGDGSQRLTCGMDAPVPASPGAGSVRLSVRFVGPRRSHRGPSRRGAEGRQARLPRHVFADVIVHGGFRLRPGGLNQLADLPPCWLGGRPADLELAPGRGPSVTPPQADADSGSRRRAGRSRRA